MIIIRVQVAVKPEEKKAFVAQIREEMTAVPASFSGCEQFQLYEDVTDENKFLLYEEWETQAAFDAYRHSEAFATNGRKLFPMLAEKPNSAYFQAEKIE